MNEGLVCLELLTVRWYNELLPIDIVNYWFCCELRVISSELLFIGNELFANGSIHSVSNEMHPTTGFDREIRSRYNKAGSQSGSV